MRKQAWIVGVCVAFSAVSANARVTLLDPAFSDVLVVRSPSGAILDQVAALEMNEVANHLYAITSEGLCDPQYVVKAPGASVGTGTGYLLLESENGPVSDVYGVWDLDGDGSPHFGFLSDLETAIGEPYPLPINIIGSYVEVPGQQYDITPLLAPVYRQGGFTASFQSDADIPEPATLSLLVLGGLAALVRRRNRA